MCADLARTTGYRLADGRYFIVKNEGEKICVIRQILFGCGIYPAPVKDVPEKEWPEVLAMVVGKLDHFNQAPATCKRIG